LHRTGNALVERVAVHRFNGDGISWQITEDVTVKGCTVTGCSNAGLHPGTGSPRTLIDSCDCSGNDRFGLFVCWRVRNGQVRNSRFSSNGLSGICTGHKDTDMLFEGNHIFENKGGGIHFRPETPSNAPHRNVFRGNRVENNGGFGFSFDSPARDVVLDSNIIRNTEGGQQKAAVRIGRDGLKPSMIKNRITGHPDGEMVIQDNTGGI
ncbi:right-handed parallel beta-helix repeat-containing protein, partial [bacterium]|nr:right-handed parallel beta-helix repeat-containing protein [bacterium]